MIEEWRNRLAGAWAGIAEIVRQRWYADVELFDEWIDVWAIAHVGAWGLFLMGQLMDE